MSYIRKGFTLVEILIVLALIGLFVAATSYLTHDSRIAQKNAERLADNINTTFRTARTNMVLGKGVLSGSTLTTTDKRVISIGSAGITTVYGTTNTGTESNLPYPFYDGDTNYKITDISVSSGILRNGFMPTWDHTGVLAADITILKDGSIQISSSVLPINTKINAIRITAGYEGFEQSVMLDRIMGRSEVVQGKGETIFVTTPSSVTAWSMCSGGNQFLTCIEQIGGDPITCASRGFIGGINNRSCGTTAVCSTTQFLCTSGTSVSNVANSCNQNATWGCNSSDGGINVTCSKPNPICINGVCSSGINYYSLAAGVCLGGSTPVSLAGTGPWTWGCNSPNGGTDTAPTACTANKSVDCIGTWGVCSGGSQTYTVSTPAANGGLACSSTNGATQGCGTPAVCSATFNAYPTPAPTCVTGNPTAVSGTGPWTWGCNSPNGGTDTAPTACTANKSVDCIGTWGACSLGSQTYTISTPAANGGLSCSSTNGATQGCGTPAVCSATFNSYPTPAPTCVTGNPTAVSGTGPWTWGCNSPNGGTDTAPTACTANKSVDCIGTWGACSLGSQTYTISTPAANGGLACSSVNGATQSCGTPAVCSATFNAYPTPAPTCATGNPTAISGTGPWTWGCNSTNGGTNTTAAACSANKKVNCVGAWGVCSGGSQTYTISTAAANGGLSCSSTNGATQGCGTPAVCNNATQFACTSGTSVSNVAGSCDGSSTWGCNSTNGGTNTTATACTKANPSCGNTVPGGAGGYFPQIAASKDGTRFFITWSDSVGWASNVYGIVYDNNGSIVRSTFLVESTPCGASCGSPNIRVKDVGNSNFVITWPYTTDRVSYSTHYQIYNNNGTATSPVYNIAANMVLNSRLAEYNNGANFAISGGDYSAGTSTTILIKGFTLSSPTVLAFNQSISCATDGNNGEIGGVGTDLILVHNCNNIATVKRFNPAGGVVWNKTLWPGMLHTWHDLDSLAVRYDNLGFFVATNTPDPRVRYFDVNGNLVWATTDTTSYGWISITPMRKTGFTDRAYITDSNNTIPFGTYQYGSYGAGSASQNLLLGILRSDIDSNTMQLRAAQTQTQVGLTYNGVGNAVSFKIITFPTSQCTPGTYSPTSFPTCTSASAGYHVPTTGATTQTICPVNKYQGSTGQSSCTACPGGTGSPAGSTSVAQCLAACPSGYTYISTTCVSALRKGGLQAGWDDCASVGAVMTRATNVVAWCPITGPVSGLCADISVGDHFAWNPWDRNNYGYDLINSVTGRSGGGSGGPIATYPNATYPTGGTTDPANGSHYYYCTK